MRGLSFSMDTRFSKIITNQTDLELIEIYSECHTLLLQLFDRNNIRIIFNCVIKNVERYNQINAHGRGGSLGKRGP